MISLYSSLQDAYDNCCCGSSFDRPFEIVKDNMEGIITKKVYIDYIPYNETIEIISYLGNGIVFSLLIDDGFDSSDDSVEFSLSVYGETYMVDEMPLKYLSEKIETVTREMNKKDK